jgi:hypothetical protein
MNGSSKKRVILSTIDQMSSESTKVRIEELYDRLKEANDMDRVVAGKLVIQLYKAGEVS